MKRNILKEYIREILLREEIITVSRGKDSDVYDAVFDKDGNIVSAKRAAASADVTELINFATTQTSASKSTIYKKLTSGVETQQDAISPANVAKVLQSDWLTEMLFWAPTNRIGKGEAAVKLAFKSDLSADEPDFVSHDGKVKLSLKFFGDDGSGTVRGGEAAGAKYQDLIKEIISITGSTLILKVPTYSATQLTSDLMKLNPAERGDAINKLREIVTAAKLTLLEEHNPDAILAFDGVKGVSIIDRTNYANSLSLYSFRGPAGRVEFYGPNVSGRRKTFENALNEVEASLGSSQPNVKPTGGTS